MARSAAVASAPPRSRPASRRRPGRCARSRTGRDPRGQHGDRVPRGGVLPDQRGERLGAQQRHVAVGDDDDAGQVAERLGDHADRVAGADQLVLDDDPHVRGVPGRFGAHLVPAVPDHDDEALRAELGRRRQRVPEHAATAQGMQHLRDARSHPRALARGEDDDGDRARFAHGASLLGLRAGSSGQRRESARRTAQPALVRMLRVPGCDGECVYPPLICRIPSGGHDRMAGSVTARRVFRPGRSSLGYGHQPGKADRPGSAGLLPGGLRNRR